MTTAQLQDEIEKGRAALAAAEEKIAHLNEEINTLKGSVSGNPAAQALGDAAHRFKELITNLQNGIFLVDEHKKIVVVNDMFCKMFGIVVPPEALIGTDGEKVTAQIRPLFKNPDEYKIKVNEILSEKKKVLKDELELLTGQVFSRDFIPIFFNNTLCIKAPIFQVCSCTQATDYLFYPGLKFFYCFIIQVIPMVVCNKKIINIRNVTRTIYIRSIKSFYRE